jgi:hypothetical protein
VTLIRQTLCLTFAGLVALAAGCGTNGTSNTNNDPSRGSDQPKTKADPAAQAEGKKYLLASEPAKAQSIIDVRKSAKDGDEVVVAGQVGGSDKPFTEGRASFLLVDASLKAESTCDCPWDFCELPKKELAASRLSVKLVDADGKTVKHGAREMFGIKELSQVVVKGKVSRDDKDNVVVVASGLYVRPEQK